jgi:hypothetical protein
VLDGRERQKQGQGAINERHWSVGCVPFRRPLVFGVDEKRHSTDFRRGEQTSSSGRQDQLPPQPLSLDRAIQSLPENRGAKGTVPGGSRIGSYVTVKESPSLRRVLG